MLNTVLMATDMALEPGAANMELTSRAEGIETPAKFFDR
jgi:hypothetical protein